MRALFPAVFIFLWIVEAGICFIGTYWLAEGVAATIAPWTFCLQDLFPFYTDNLGFYWEHGGIKSFLHISYPGFESYEDFQAHKDLYMLDNDRRFNPERMSPADQKSFYMNIQLTCFLLMAMPVGYFLVRQFY